MLRESSMEMRCEVCGGAHPTGACFSAGAEEERTGSPAEAVMHRERTLTDRLRGHAREVALALSVITAGLITGLSRPASADVGIKLEPGAGEFLRRRAEEEALKKLRVESPSEEMASALQKIDAKLQGTKIVFGASREGGVHLSLDLCGLDVKTSSLKALKDQEGGVTGVKGTSVLHGGGIRIITAGMDGWDIVYVPPSDKGPI